MILDLFFFSLDDFLGDLVDCYLLSNHILGFVFKIYTFFLPGQWGHFLNSQMTELKW